MNAPLISDSQWHCIEGNLIFGNLVLANDEEARVVVCKSRKEFDAFLSREGLTAQSIDWTARSVRLPEGGR